MCEIFKYVFGRPYPNIAMFSMLDLEIWQRLPIRKRLPSFSGARNSLTLPPVVSASAICPHDELIYILISVTILTNTAKFNVRC